MLYDIISASPLLILDACRARPDTSKETTADYLCGRAGPLSLGRARDNREHPKGTLVKEGVLPTNKITHRNEHGKVLTEPNVLRVRKEKHYYLLYYYLLLVLSFSLLL